MKYLSTGRWILNTSFLSLVNLSLSVYPFTLAGLGQPPIGRPVNERYALCYPRPLPGP